VDGQLKSKYGDCFIRGNNGEFFSRWNNFETSTLLPRLFLSRLAKIFFYTVLYISSRKR
jgi:hypothetical protein